MVSTGTAGPPSLKNTASSLGALPSSKPALRDPPSSRKMSRLYFEYDTPIIHNIVRFATRISMPGRRENHVDVVVEIILNVDQKLS